jgi:hypothetical protein
MPSNASLATAPAVVAEAGDRQTMCIHGFLQLGL